MNVHLTPEQTQALAELTAREGAVTLHQLDGEAAAADLDVYATPRGQRNGFRISPGGEVSEIGETLPAD